MCGALSRRVDPWQAALTGNRVAGTLDAARLPRLSVLAEPVGLLQVSLDFERWHPHGQPGARSRATEAVRVVVGVTGCLRSTCQRCLEPVEFPADLNTVVMVAMDDTMGDAADRVVVEAGELLDTGSLVEDELILALPFAPAHADNACADGQSGAKAPAPELAQDELEGRADNPFAVLGALKGRGRGDS